MLHKVSVRHDLRLVGKNNLHMRLHFQIKQKFVIFQFLQCHGGLLFFEHVLMSETHSNELKSIYITLQIALHFSLKYFDCKV